MSNISSFQLNQLKEDIGFIRSTIEKNTPLFQKITYPIRSLCIGSGVLLLVSCIIFYFLGKYHGSFNEIPLILRCISFSIIGIAIIGLVVYKIKTITANAQAIDPSLTAHLILKEFYQSSLTHIIYIPVFVCMLILSYFAFHNHHAEYIVSIIAIGTGLLWISYGGTWHINLFLKGGYWLLISGLCALFLYAESV